jgi:hypothetical protein
MFANFSIYSEFTFSVIKTECLLQFFLHGLRVLLLQEVCRDTAETVKVDFTRTWWETPGAYLIKANSDCLISALHIQDTN